MFQVQEERVGRDRSATVPAIGTLPAGASIRKAPPVRRPTSLATPPKYCG